MLTKQRGRTRSAGGQNLQELSRAHDPDALIGAELPQLSITRHEVFGRAAQRGAEDFVVRWVRGHAGYWRGYRNWRRKGAYKVQKGRRRARGQAPDEIRLRQRAGELLEDISGNDDFERTLKPRVDNLGGSANRGHRPGCERIGVQDGPNHTLGTARCSSRLSARTSAMARATSC